VFLFLIFVDGGSTINQSLL